MLGHWTVLHLGLLPCTFLIVLLLATWQFFVVNQMKTLIKPHSSMAAASFLNCLSTFEFQFSFCKSRIKCQICAYVIVS